MQQQSRLLELMMEKMLENEKRGKENEEQVVENKQKVEKNAKILKEQEQDKKNEPQQSTQAPETEQAPEVNCDMELTLLKEKKTQLGLLSPKCKTILAEKNAEKAKQEEARKEKGV